MGSISTSRQWLITGASSGLGLAMSLSALKAGHKVLAGARNPIKAASDHPELEAAGGKWLQLDVSLPEAQSVVAKAVEAAGKIDVVVNNAGGMIVGTVEDLTEEEIAQNMSTSFYGPIRVIKAVLPLMRIQKSGTIIFNSSIFGIYPCPGIMAYNCSRAATNMLQDTLRVELAPFNIRLLTLCPGLFKTNVLDAGGLASNGLKQEYLEQTHVGTSLGMVGSFRADPDACMPGDPAKFGDHVVDLVDGTGYGEGLGGSRHVFMGRDGLELAKKRHAAMGAEIEAATKFATSTDFEGATARGVSAVGDFPY